MGVGSASYPNTAQPCESSLTVLEDASRPGLVGGKGHQHIGQLSTVAIRSFLVREPAGEEKKLHFSATRGSQSTPKLLSCSHPAHCTVALTGSLSEA